LNVLLILSFPSLCIRQFIILRDQLMLTQESRKSSRYPTAHYPDRRRIVSRLSSAERNKPRTFAAKGLLLKPTLLFFAPFVYPPQYPKATTAHIRQLGLFPRSVLNHTTITSLSRNFHVRHNQSVGFLQSAHTPKKYCLYILFVYH
jgi:hypothetical protein